MSGPQNLSTHRLGTLEGVTRAGEARGSGPQISLVLFHADQSRVVRLSDGQGEPVDFSCP